MEQPFTNISSLVLQIIIFMISFPLKCDNDRNLFECTYVFIEMDSRSLKILGGKCCYVLLNIDLESFFLILEDYLFIFIYSLWK